MFFERLWNRNDWLNFEGYLTFIQPNRDYFWELYHPNSNSEYLTIFNCLDYFGIISEDVKKGWRINVNNAHNSEKSYIKKIVNMLKEKYPINKEEKKGLKKRNIDDYYYYNYCRDIIDSYIITV